MKYEQLEPFGRALPRLRARVEEDLRRNRPDRDLVTAALVRLIDGAALRVGSQSYARENGTIGATTLQSRHVALDGTRLKLDYRAKGGQRVRKQIKDRTLARVLGRIDDLPGRMLFTYLDEDDETRTVRSDDVNAYIAETMDLDEVTAKTFRTWQGSVVALDHAASEPDTLTIKALAEAASRRLHNTPSIARSSYIHPRIIALAEMDATERKATLDAVDLRRAPNDLPTEEKRLVALLAG